MLLLLDKVVNWALCYHVSSVGCSLPGRSRGDGLYDFRPPMTQAYGYDRTNEMMNGTHPNE